MYVYMYIYMYLYINVYICMCSNVGASFRRQSQIGPGPVRDYLASSAKACSNNISKNICMYICMCICMYINAYMTSISKNPYPYINIKLQMMKLLTKGIFQFTCIYDTHTYMYI